MRKINKRYFRSMRTNRSFHLVVILLTVLISCGAAVLFPVTPEAPETAGTEEVQA